MYSPALAADDVGLHILSKRAYGALKRVAAAVCDLAYEHQSNPFPFLV